MTLLVLIVAASVCALVMGGARSRGAVLAAAAVNGGLWYAIFQAVP